MLSEYVDQGYTHELLAESAAGVGYLLKQRVVGVERFVDAIRQVGHGGSVLDPEVVSQILRRDKRDRTGLDEPTERELATLTLMAEGRSNQGIASDLFVTDRTVEKHVRSIFEKLEARGRAQRAPPGPGGPALRASERDRPRRRLLLADAGPEQQLPKRLRWYDGFVFALANPGFLIGFLGYSIGALGGWTAAALWTVSMVIGTLSNWIYSEMAAMFPEKSGGIALYAHEGWRRYLSLVGPVATFGYWFAWSSVLSIFGLVVGSLIQAEWFPGSDWTFSTGWPTALASDTSSARCS